MHGSSAYQETREQAAQRRAAERGENGNPASLAAEPFGEDVEIGGASGMGESALSAYKEMAAGNLVYH